MLDVNELHDSNNQYEDSSNFENEPNSILSLKKLLADVESEDLSNPNPSREEYSSAFHYDALSSDQKVFVDTLYDEISKTKLEAFTLEL